MRRFTTTFLALAIMGASSPLKGQSPRRLTAPTFYIAAKAENGLSQVDVGGVTNLPPGAKLTVFVYDFIREGGSELSEDAFAVVGQDGFFKVSLYPKNGKQFKQQSMVCSILFAPDYLKQTASVLKVVGGTHGTALGGALNPQIGLNSGEYWSLQDLVYVPPVPKELIR